MRACPSSGCSQLAKLTAHKTPYMDELTRLTNDSICAVPPYRHHRHTTAAPLPTVYRRNPYQYEHRKNGTAKKKNMNNLCTAGELIWATTNNAHSCRRNNNGIFIINYMIRCSECSKQRTHTKTQNTHIGALCGTTKSGE